MHSGSGIANQRRGRTHRNDAVGTVAVKVDYDEDEDVLKQDKTHIISIHAGVRVNRQ